MRAVRCGRQAVRKLLYCMSDTRATASTAHTVWGFSRVLPGLFEGNFRSVHKMLFTTSVVTVQHFNTVFLLTLGNRYALRLPYQ